MSFSISKVLSGVCAEMPPLWHCFHSRPSCAYSSLWTGSAAAAGRLVCARFLRDLRLQRLQSRAALASTNAPPPTPAIKPRTGRPRGFLLGIAWAVFAVFLAGPRTGVEVLGNSTWRLEVGVAWALLSVVIFVCCQAAPPLAAPGRCFAIQRTRKPVTWCR